MIADIIFAYLLIGLGVVLESIDESTNKRLAVALGPWILILWGPLFVWTIADWVRE